MVAGPVWRHYDGANYGILPISLVSASGRFGNGFDWIWDGQLHFDANWLWAYDYTNDELAYYAKTAGTPTYDNSVSFLKYSYATHRVVRQTGYLYGLVAVDTDGRRGRRS